MHCNVHVVLTAGDGTAKSIPHKMVVLKAWWLGASWQATVGSKQTANMRSHKMANWQPCSQFSHFLTRFGKFYDPFSNNPPPPPHNKTKSKTITPLLKGLIVSISQWMCSHLAVVLWTDCFQWVAESSSTCIWLNSSQTERCETCDTLWNTLQFTNSQIQCFKLSVTLSDSNYYSDHIKIRLLDFSLNPVGISHKSWCQQALILRIRG